MRIRLPHRPSGDRRRTLVTYLGAALVVVIVVVAAVVLVVRARSSDGTELQQAMARALPDGQRYSWTDWSAVREKLDQPLDTDSTPQELARMLDKGFVADLTSSSTLLSSARTMQQHYGFSPASLDWELYTQADHSQVLMMKLGPSNDVGHIEQTLRLDGYAEPSTPEGIWVGDPDSIKRLGEVTPELDLIVVDAKDGLLLSSDNTVSLAEGVKALNAPQDLSGGLADVAAVVGTPLSAELYTSDQVCSALAMSGADPSDVRAGEQLVARAGPVNPLTGFAMADQPDGDTLVAMGFDSHDTAVTNARTRAVLASGPAPGQGGTFGERYKLGRVAADGSVVTMLLHPKEGEYLMTDLSTGPLLWATC